MCVCVCVCTSQTLRPLSRTLSSFYSFFHESVAMCSLIIQKTPGAFYKTRFVSCWTFRLMSKVCVVGIGSLQTCLYDSEVKQVRSKKSKSVQKGFVFYILFSATQERKRVESLCLKFFWCKGDASECSYQTGRLFCLFCPPWRLMATGLPFL